VLRAKRRWVVRLCLERADNWRGIFGSGRRAGTARHYRSSRYLNAGKRMLLVKRRVTYTQTGRCFLRARSPRPRWVGGMILAACSFEHSEFPRWLNTSSQKRGSQHWPFLHKPHELRGRRLRDGAHSALCEKDRTRHANYRLCEARSGPTRIACCPHVGLAPLLHGAVLGLGKAARLGTVVS